MVTLVMVIFIMSVTPVLTTTVAGLCVMMMMIVMIAIILIVVLMVDKVWVIICGDIPSSSSPSPSLSGSTQMVVARRQHWHPVPSNSDRCGFCVLCVGCPGGDI